MSASPTRDDLIADIDRGIVQSAPASFPSDTIEEYMPGGHEKPLTIALPR